MSVLLTGDWHLSENHRDAYRHEWQDHLIGIVSKYAVEAVFVLGDLTEEKQGHSAWLTNTIAGYIHNLSLLAHVVILRGNHDATDPRWPFFRFLGHLPNCHWVNGVTDLDDLLLELKTDLGRVVLLPHTTTPDKDWAKIQFGMYDKAFAHATFAGTQTEGGFALDGVSLEPFNSGRTLIYSGDIHHPHRHGIVTYVGSPYTVDFGDKYKGRVLILDDGKVTSVSTKTRQKRLVEVDSVDEAGIRYQLDTYNPDLLQGDIINVQSDP